MRRMRIMGVAAVVALGTATTTAGTASAVLTLTNGNSQNVPIVVGEQFVIKTVDANFDLGSYNVFCDEAGYSGFVAKNQQLIDELRLTGPVSQFRAQGEYGDGFCTVNGASPFGLADVGALGTLALKVDENGITTLRPRRYSKLEFEISLGGLFDPNGVTCYFDTGKFDGTNSATPVTTSEPNGAPLVIHFIDQPLTRIYRKQYKGCPNKIDVTMTLGSGVTLGFGSLYEHI
jgi:hypothetical protein